MPPIQWAAVITELVVIGALFWSPSIYALVKRKGNLGQVVGWNIFGVFFFPWVIAWVNAARGPLPPVVYQPPDVVHVWQPPPAPPTPPAGFEEHTLLLPKDPGAAP